MLLDSRFLVPQAVEPAAAAQHRLLPCCDGLRIRKSLRSGYHHRLRPAFAPVRTLREHHMLVVRRLVGPLRPESVEHPLRAVFQHMEMIVERVTDPARVAVLVGASLPGDEHFEIVRDQVAVQRRVEIVPVEVVRPALPVVPRVAEVPGHRLVGGGIAVADLGRFRENRPLALVGCVLAGESYPNHRSLCGRIGGVEGEDGGQGGVFVADGLHRQQFREIPAMEFPDWPAREGGLVAQDGVAEKELLRYPVTPEVMQVLEG